MRLFVKQALLLLMLAALVSGCDSASSNEVDEFLDTYEEVIESYGEMVTSDILSSEDPAAMLKAFNDMNEKNIELSQKVEQLKDLRWTSAQQKRQLELVNRYSEIMMQLQESM